MTTPAGTESSARYASPVDYDRYGPYGPGRGFDPGQGFHRPRYRFQGRITADGASGFPAAPGRYHLYLGWGCPWAQRTAIVRTLMGLADVVSLSYVDDERDGRGWAFRQRRGPDPVNGFRFLAEAYTATEPGYDGHVSVPVLWDRVTGKVVSNNFPDITIDLGSAFGAWADESVELYPEPLRPAMIATLEELDRRLAGRRLLFGSQITEADIRLWPTLARFDVGYNPMAGVSERRLTDFPNLWAYARDLYQRPAFRDTTDFTSFGGLTRGPKPSFLNDGAWRITVEPRLADWDTPSGRERL